MTTPSKASQRMVPVTPAADMTSEHGDHIAKLARLVVDILELSAEGLQFDQMDPAITHLAIAQKRGAALEAITDLIIDFEPDVEQTAGVVPITD